MFHKWDVAGIDRTEEHGISSVFAVPFRSAT